MNPYEHAQQPATPEPPSGLPIAGAPPPAYDPNQGYAPAPANSYEHAQPAGYGYQQAAAPPAYPQTPAYYQNPGYQQAAPTAYPQTPAYQQQPPPQPPQMPPGYQQPLPEMPPAYIITPGAPGTAVKKSGAGKKLALIAVVALVVIGGGGAFAADAWAKGQVCDAVTGLADDTNGSSAKSGSGKNSGKPTVAELDAAEKALNSRASLLFFHSDLKDATHDLADDVDTLKTLVAKGKLAHPDAKTATQLLALAASLDSHARKAQRACGLPEKSLMGTTA